MTDVFLYSGEPNPNDVKLSDPTVLRAGSGAYTLVADVGAFVVAGQPAALLRNYTLTAATGAFVLAGQAASPLHQSGLTALPGAFVLAGQPATETVGHRLSAAAGAFVLSGQAAALTEGHGLSAASGAFVLDGQAATLTYTPGSGAYVLSAGTGSFALTGMDATLTPSSEAPAATGGGGRYPYRTLFDPLPLTHYTLRAQSGRFQLRGHRAALLRSYTLAAEAGAFVLTGQETAWHRTYQLAATPGRFAALGTPAKAFRGVRSVWVTRTLEPRSVVPRVGTQTPPVPVPLVASAVCHPAPDAIDRAWTDLQGEEDELLLLGVIA